MAGAGQEPLEQDPSLEGLWLLLGSSVLTLNCKEDVELLVTNPCV